MSNTSRYIEHIEIDHRPGEVRYTLEQLKAPECCTYRKVTATLSAEDEAAQFERCVKAQSLWKGYVTAIKLVIEKSQRWPYKLEVVERQTVYRFIAPTIQELYGNIEKYMEDQLVKQNQLTLDSLESVREAAQRLES